MPRRTDASWDSLRLTDRIQPGVRVLFVGINPGVRSAETGHHFAGPSNRFWKLLWESRLVPEPITYEQDGRLSEFGFGITNIIARPSPGIDVLKPAEYVEGWKVLEAKIEKYRPGILALVGVTVFRAVLPLIVGAEATPAHRPEPSPKVRGGGTLRVRGSVTPKVRGADTPRVRGADTPRPNGSDSVRARPGREAAIGLQPYTVHGARVFVLPNPSGRNANFSYPEMLAAFRALRRLTHPRTRPST